MAIRPVLVIGDPRLRQISQAVPLSLIGSRELEALIGDLRDTMAASDGAGLAAPQIAVPLRLVIFGITTNPRYPEAPPIPETILINPEITPLGDEQQLGSEGCLSVPGRRAEVQRARRIRYRALTPAGQWIEREVEGFHARVVQHECDHLDGVLFPDRLPSTNAEAAAADGLRSPASDPG
ncbi:MAG: peptide deformylase [Synechococcaceae cyanobacterium ELA739]